MSPASKRQRRAADALLISGTGFENRRTGPAKTGTRSTWLTGRTQGMRSASPGRYRRLFSTNTAVTYRIELTDEQHEVLTGLLLFYGGGFDNLLKAVENAEYRPTSPEERLAFDVGVEARRLRRAQEHRTGFWFQR